MTAPLSLTGRYQLVVIGPEGHARVAECAAGLAAAVRHGFETLGVNPRKFLVEVAPGAAGTIDRRLPAVGVFFGLAASPVLSADAAGRLRTLLDDETLVIPVVDDLAELGSMVPPEVAALNGCSLADCGAGFERLAARILEGLGLLRAKRRLFISYRRVESSGVAAQLYEALDAAGFDVFLDTKGGIPTGDPFQEVLWHRLADTDVAVLLDTPGFLASRWTEEELARANTSNIQILQILWPGQTEGGTAAFSTFHPLEASSFSEPDRIGPAAQLGAKEVGEIVDAVEGLRARALQARRAFLVREFALEARDGGLRVQTTLEQNLILSAPDGTKVLVMPAIGVPDAERYEDVGRLHRRDLDLGRAYGLPPVLLYDQTGIRRRWLDHLSWLNENISCARSLSIADAKAWLADLSSRTV